MSAQTAGRRGKAPEPTIVLRGPPSRLAAARPLPVDVVAFRAGRVPASAISLRVGDTVAERVRVRAPREPGESVELRARIARSTPPGRYQGRATVGERNIPVVIEVQAAPRLRAAPSRIETIAQPSGSDTVEVDLVNSGNVPTVIPARSSFCLFDAGGIDHAVWTALTESPGEKGRLEMLLDDLASSHGGLVDVRVRAGGGSLAPGERRTCRIELNWSDRLRPGRRYAGSWELAGLRLPFRVETPRERPTRGSPAPEGATRARPSRRRAPATPRRSA